MTLKVPETDSFKIKMQKNKVENLTIKIFHLILCLAESVPAVTVLIGLQMLHSAR